MRKYLFIIVAALIIFLEVNYRSINKAVELCVERKGQALVQKDVFAMKLECSPQDVKLSSSHRPWDSHSKNFFI
ncbi:hypothetical protein [Bacillus sp. NTK034]|uniref:hypothetical protein n=1 Tax=Bacillus sp. NTK034 TaxID=2802176 RepID=UPI001A8CD446|nr:hypothetical protein [Bacillus sp. NTK034]MBN8201183.1 hypothetical protein [Bacillus sp. NTK034]